MDQIKIGKFIAQCRKNASLTQAQLAEQLNITDRAVSKWETGKSLPDASIMLELCQVLGISVNDLLSGEVITMDNYNQEVEKNLLEMVRQKQQADKRLLTAEVFIGITATVVLFTLILLAAFLNMPTGIRITHTTCISVTLRQIFRDFFTIYHSSIILFQLFILTDCKTGIFNFLYFKFQ